MTYCNDAAPLMSDSGLARIRTSGPDQGPLARVRAMVMRRSIFALILVPLLNACAHHAVILGRPTIRSIAIIPASNPTSFTLENLPIPIGSGPLYLATKLYSRSKAKGFNNAAKPDGSTLGTDLTNEVAAALRADGFVVEILQDVKRPEDEPDNIDYNTISTNADAILHLTISEVGLFSSSFSRNYVPRVNASGKLFVKGREDDIYQEDIYYGADAKKGKEWAILPDPKYAYPSIDAVMSNVQEIRAAFAVGIAEISRRMTEQINHSTNYLKAAAPPAPMPAL